MRVAIYDVSRQIGLVEGEPRAAWREASRLVRALARGDRRNDGWYSLGNRNEYSRGRFHAASLRSQETS